MALPLKTLEYTRFAPNQRADKLTLWNGDKFLWSRHTLSLGDLAEWGDEKSGMVVISATGTSENLVKYLCLPWRENK